MITICPQCQLPLAVTAADLRIAQGQVRCGRCAAVFNALASLYEPGNVAVERRGATGPDSLSAGGAASAPATASAPAEVTVTRPEDAAPVAAETTPQPIAAPVDEPAADAPGLAGDAARPRRDPDWEIDTMTAAELAALVARADRDEPDELASIQIAVDDASEITVLPSESPRVLPPAEPAMGSAMMRIEAQSRADEHHARSLPRLDAVPADDPEIERAQAAVAARARAPSRNEPSLRWLELEPAQPAPGSLAASLGLAAEGDFGARTGVGLDDRSLPQTAEAREPRPLDLDFSADAGEASDPDDDARDPALEIAATGAASRGAPLPRWMRPATVVLGLALAVQLVNLYREDLVGIPALQAPLTGLYAALGQPLAPRWEIGRYEVRQQGVVAEPVAAGTLTVRASIRNGAGRAQPAPMLRVTLQDRFGNRVATRDLTPREYGGAAALAPAPMLAPGQRIDAEVSLLDPGGEAVGFELDVCLRRPDDSISCANDRSAANG